jgi:hypothetical protein
VHTGPSALLDFVDQRTMNSGDKVEVVKVRSFAMSRIVYSYLSLQRTADATGIMFFQIRRCGQPLGTVEEWLDSIDVTQFPGPCA